MKIKLNFYNEYDELIIELYGEKTYEILTKKIIENIKSIYTEEALHRLVEIHYIIGLSEEAKKYAQILGYNYQSSEWYEKSYNLLNDIGISQNNTNWFEKFNPIKLFINTSKDVLP